MYAPRAVVLLLALPAFAAAQPPLVRPIEVTGYLGYQTGSSSTSRVGDLEIDDSVAFGAMLDVRVREDATIQLLYHRQPTTLDFRESDPFSPRVVVLDIAVEQYQLGGTVEHLGESVTPYFALTLGATRFDVLSEPAGDEWRFSAGVGGGIKAYFSDRVGVRLDGRVWPIFAATDGGFFCNLPGGCLISLEADLLWQANASMGLFFTF